MLNVIKLLLVVVAIVLYNSRLKPTSINGEKEYLNHLHIVRIIAEKRSLIP